MSTSLRVSQSTRARASALAAASGRSLGELVEAALDDYERARFWEQAREALASAPSEAEAEAAAQDDVAWSTTLRDGLPGG